LAQDEETRAAQIWQPSRPIPQQWQARVVFQSTEAPEKEWRGWYTEEDSEVDIESRAHTSLGIVGIWRRSSFWQDETGVTITMTNSRKEIQMRYSGEGDGEIKSLMIGENDTTRMILLALKAKSNFHLTDSENHPFALDDCPFGYISVPANPPLKFLHGSVPLRKPREPTPKKDSRMAIEVKIGGAISVYSRSNPTPPQKYSGLLAEMISKQGLMGDWHIERVRAVEDRILIEIAEGEPLSWFCESVCPPLRSEDDKLLRASYGVGGWGIIPPTAPMQTRAAA
jgi:hypothetical protein